MIATGILCERLVLRTEETIHKPQMKNNLMQLLHFCRLMELSIPDLYSDNNVS